MRTLLIILSLTTLLSTHAKETKSSPQWKSRIVAACLNMIKNSAYCNCAAQKHLEPGMLTSDQVTWLEKLYNRKLTEAEIERDLYGIAEFELSVEQTCRPLRK